MNHLPALTPRNAFRRVLPAQGEQKRTQLGKKGVHKELAHAIHVLQGIHRKVTSSHVHRVRKGGQERLLVIRRTKGSCQFAHPKIRVAICHGYAQSSETNKEWSRHGTQWAEHTMERCEHQFQMTPVATTIPKHETRSCQSRNVTCRPQAQSGN